MKVDEQDSRVVFFILLYLCHSIIIGNIRIINKKHFRNSQIILVISSNLLQHKEPAPTHQGDDVCHSQRLVLIFEQTALLL